MLYAYSMLGMRVHASRLCNKRWGCSSTRIRIAPLSPRPITKIFLYLSTTKPTCPGDIWISVSVIPSSVWASVPYREANNGNIADGIQVDMDHLKKGEVKYAFLSNSNPPPRGTYQNILLRKKLIFRQLGNLDVSCTYPLGQYLPS